MGSRSGSVSSGLRSSPGMRGQTLKSSPFCPHSSSKLTQSIVRDHMVSHYKKIYSAKAAIDASVPKSLIHSVKYNDQIRQERLRKGVRPQSAHSLSQRNSRASCSQSQLSVQYDDSPYLCSRSPTVSRPRFGTSFHVKEIVYPSWKVGSQSSVHHARPASEMIYRSPAVPLHRKQSVCSLAASGDQGAYKTFKDPIQKTYSGDLLEKHSQHFTQDKPFTPKTLKSDRSSYLSGYRYYRAPRRKATQDCTQTGSTKSKEYTQEVNEPSQGLNTEQEGSQDEFSGSYFAASRQQSQANKSRNSFFSESSSRLSPDDGKSPTMKNLSAEEEELMYLEFISDVTEDILSRRHISERVLDRVIERHVDMNRHRLDLAKMRHLLEVLRKDFEDSTNASTCSTDFEKNEKGLLDAFQSYLESGGKHVEAPKNNDLFPYASLINSRDSPDHADTLLASTPLCSPETAAPQTKANEKDGEDLEKRISSPWLSDHVSSNIGVSEEDVQQSHVDKTATNEVSDENHEYATITSEKGFHQNKEQDFYDELSEELQDLGRRLSESLHVSRTEEHTNSASSASDDEF